MAKEVQGPTRTETSALDIELTHELSHSTYSPKSSAEIQAEIDSPVSLTKQRIALAASITALREIAKKLESESIQLLDLRREHEQLKAEIQEELEQAQSTNLVEEIRALAKVRKELAEEINQIDIQLKESQEQINDFNQQIYEVQQQRQELEKQIDTLENFEATEFENLKEHQKQELAMADNVSKGLDEKQEVFKDAVASYNEAQTEADNKVTLDTAKLGEQYKARTVLRSNAVDAEAYYQQSVEAYGSGREHKTLKYIEKHDPAIHHAPPAPEQPASAESTKAPEMKHSRMSMLQEIRLIGVISKALKEENEYLNEYEATKLARQIVKEASKEMKESFADTKPGDLKPEAYKDMKELANTQNRKDNTKALNKLHQLKDDAEAKEGKLTKLRNFMSERHEHHLEMRDNVKEKFSNLPHP